MKTSCTRCDSFAKETVELGSDEVNQETGLCWGVCDMERENDEAEQAEYDYLASDY